MGMRQFALLVAVVVLVGCGKKPLFDPNNKDHVKIEAAIRKELKKPEGELTKADLAKVRRLALSTTRITDAGLKEVAKMKQLTKLHLSRTKITDAGVAELKKALPKCEIESNPTK